MKIIAFGRIAEITGREIHLDAPDVGTLRQTLSNDFPELANQKFAIAVNKQISSDVIKLTSTDEIALMPPYSGG